MHTNCGHITGCGRPVEGPHCRGTTVHLWRNRSGCVFQFELSTKLVGHTGSVTVLDAIYITNDQGDVRTLVASASVDSSVKIWERKNKDSMYFNDPQNYIVGVFFLFCHNSILMCISFHSGEFSCIQSLALGNGFALSVAWIQLPESKGRCVCFYRP